MVRLSEKAALRCLEEKELHEGFIWCLLHREKESSLEKTESGVEGGGGE